MTETQSPSRARRRMRRATSFTAMMLATVILAGCGLLGGGKAPASTANVDTTKTTFADSSTMGTIKKRGRLIVGVRWDAKPFAFKDPSTGSPSGFDVDLVKQIARTIFDSDSIESKITWVPLDPRNNELALEQDKVDLVVGRYQITVPKKTYVDFAGPYLSDPQSIMISTKGNPLSSPKSIGDFNGLKLCAITGSTDIASVKDLAPGADISDVRANINQCGADLISGAVSGVAASRVDLLQFVNISGNVSILDGQYAPALYGIGVKKNTDDLRSFVNDQLGVFKWSESFSRWISQDSSDLKQPIPDRY